MLRKCYFRPRKWVFGSNFILFGSNFVVFAQILVCRVGDIKLVLLAQNFWLKFWCVVLAK
jgi:hypothetical protein